LALFLNILQIGEPLFLYIILLIQLGQIALFVQNIDKPYKFCK
jgi:hypothetical protein